MLQRRSLMDDILATLGNTTMRTAIAVPDQLPQRLVQPSNCSINDVRITRRTCPQAQTNFSNIMSELRSGLEASPVVGLLRDPKTMLAVGAKLRALKDDPALGGVLSKVRGVTGFASVSLAISCVLRALRRCRF